MGREKLVPEEKSINRRLREAREQLEGTRGKLRFARKIGESHSNISRYERGRTIPAHVLTRLVRAYGVSAQWLLSGKGEMLEPTSADRMRELSLTMPPAAGKERSTHVLSEREVADFYVLPLLRDATAAGPGRRITEADIEGPAVIHKAWCPHPARTDYVRVKGDSMEPGIRDGAIVTIDKTYTAAENMEGEVVAIYIAATEEVTLRRLLRDDTNPSRLVGVPDNPGGPNRPHVVEEDDRLIGRVISVHSLVK